MQRQLYINSRSVRGMKWSPDGQRILYLSNLGVQQQLYVIEVAQRLEQRRMAAQGAEAAWSPDGHPIVYLSDRDLYVIDADGCHPIRLTEGAAGHSPVWSPDSGQIAYLSNHGEYATVHVVSLEGVSRPVLPDPVYLPGTLPRFTWVPGHTQLALYGTIPARGSGLHLIPTDDASPYRLLPDTGPLYAWRP